MKSKLTYFLVNFAARFATTLMTFVLLRLYGVEEVGVFSYLLGVVALLVPAAEFGVGSTYLIESVKNNYPARSLLLARVLLSTALLAFLTFSSIIFFNIEGSLIIVAMLALNFVCVNAVATFYIGRNEYIKSAGFRFFFSMLAFVAIIVCWILKIKFTGFINLYAIVGFLYVALLAGPLLYNGYRQLGNELKKLMWVLLNNSHKFFVSSMILALSASLPLIVMEIIAGAEELGEFAVALRIIMVFFTIFSIISQIAFFEILKSTSPEKQLMLQLLAFFAIGGIGCVVISVLPAYLFVRFFSVSEENSVNIDAALQSLKYILLVQALNLPLGQYLASKKLIGLRLIAQFVAIVVVVALFFLTYDSRILASVHVIQAMIANEMIVFILLLMFIMKQRGKKLEVSY